MNLVRQQSNTAFYARVSTSQQATENTIESQIAELKSYAVKNKIEIMEELIFIDNGVSGASLERPGLDRLRDYAYHRKIDRVIALCPDRLSRKQVHQIILVEEFKKLGVEILFINRPLTETPEDRMLFQMQGIFSEYEREKIMERSRRGRIHAAKAGVVSVFAQAPFGFKYVSKKSGNKTATFLIDLQQSAIVKKIFHTFVNTNVSLYQLAKDLENDKILSPKGSNHWSTSSLHRLLNNPAYTGVAAYRRTFRTETKRKPNKISRTTPHVIRKLRMTIRARPSSEWIDIPVPKIIEPEVFSRAKEKLIRNGEFAPRNRKSFYLLAGLLSCEECGCSISGMKASRKYPHRKYYKCRGKTIYQKNANGEREPLCSSSPMRVESIDDVVWDQIKKLLETPDLVVNEYIRRSEISAKKGEDIELLMNRKKGDLKNKEIERQRVLDLYQDGSVNMEDTKIRLEQIKKDVAKYEQEYYLLEQQYLEKKNSLQLIDNFENFKIQMNINLNQIEPEKMREVLQLLIQDIKIHTKKKTIKVNHIIPLSHLCDLHSSLGRCWLQLYATERNSITQL